jgi:hypothetical protein
MNHAYATTAGRVQQPAQVLHQFTGVGGQRRQHRISSQHTVLTFHAYDGHGPGFLAGE